MCCNNIMWKWENFSPSSGKLVTLRLIKYFAVAPVGMGTIGFMWCDVAGSDINDDAVKLGPELATPT